MPLVIRDSYEVYLEYNEEFAILHLPRLDKLTPSVYKELVEVGVEVKAFLRTLGYVLIFAAVPESNDKVKKMVEKLGFNYNGEAEGYSVFSVESN